MVNGSGMSATTALAVVMMLVSGVFLAVQAPINTMLARGLDNGVLAACISFGTGFAVLAALVAFRGEWPAAARFAALPWWAWVGGALGAFYVWAAIWSVPRVGVVTIAAALILGQMTAALVIDRYGLFGLPQQAASWPRIAGVMLVGVGVVLSRL